MGINISEFRSNVFKLVDRVLKTRRPLEILRNGEVLHLVPATRKGRIAALVRRPGLVGDCDDLDKVSWEKEWNSDLP
jgi:hypothetical protein